MGGLAQVYAEISKIRREKLIALAKEAQEPLAQDTLDINLSALTQVIWANCCRAKLDPGCRDLKENEKQVVLDKKNLLNTWLSLQVKHIEYLCQHSHRWIDKNDSGVNEDINREAYQTLLYGLATIAEESIAEESSLDDQMKFRVDQARRMAQFVNDSPCAPLKDNVSIGLWKTLKDLLQISLRIITLGYYSSRDHIYEGILLNKRLPGVWARKTLRDVHIERLENCLNILNDSEEAVSQTYSVVV